MTYKILLGNNLDILPTLADNSIDSIVTDPPYELGFMGKKWDSSGIAYSVELWQQCLRVLKSGGHLLAFSGPRTYHRMVVSIEDAGFEIRDMISWISNKTFPKSLNIGKAIDKAAGAERKIIGTNPNVVRESKIVGGSDFGGFTKANSEVTAPATDEAKQWDGWGTGLKPTVEPIVMARKPVEGTIANNVLTYGTGGLNIDGSRIGTEQRFNSHAGNKATGFTADDDRTDAGKGMFAGNSDGGTTVQGRWPANIILDPYTAELLDEQSGQIKGGTWNSTAGARHFNNDGNPTDYQTNKKDDSIGGASRFFYVAKASKRDRNEGLEITNSHPTVKPTSLMEYLIKLVTPPSGTVLDPFTGSGSTGKAAILQGFDFIGIEMTEEYLPIIEGRLKHAEAKVAEEANTKKQKTAAKLF
jgi:site-specific DNA-methyltransferase (adenine-specific)